MKPKIFLYVDGGYPGWYFGFALAEDGHCLAQHISSNHYFAKHDLGLTSDWKHDNYKEHYSDGYELVWVDEPLKHDGLMVAYAKNQELAKEAIKEE